MPLFKTIPFSATTKILVWKISESYEELFGTISLNEKNSIRLASMKSQVHQRAFLSVRKLLQLAGYSDFDLYYDDLGKPHLKDGKFISITHSHDFSAIIISSEIVGIDIELQRDKIIKIANKFCNAEFQYLNPSEQQEFIRKLTIIWGAKEAIFKIRNEKGISFKNHIIVRSFDLKSKETIAELHFDNLIKEFKIYFEEFQGFGLVYAFSAATRNI
ncbi:4'-phosphopantetheinyl transferase [Flavobacterium sp. PL11]|uniref:4'-phosphopantetheinyl transferase family protein n=1 Tax=Flavobacterium sp. PL11 TaxID=3071717 RepID=UPI002E0BABA5|nr:4'-phosphopantetheinyl transferase [Flavobacterium sp. PL11]